MVRRTGHRTPQTIARLQRRAKVRQDMLNGLTNQHTLAIRHNVSTFTAHLDVHAILAEMNDEQKELGKHELIITLHRLEDNYREATNAWERSKESKEEVKTVRQLRKCDDCDGTGMRGKEWCTPCNGDGFLIEEVTTRKVEGVAGDVKFLQERRECMKMKCYLLGLKPEDKGGRPPKDPPHNTTINVTNINTEQVIAALVGLDTLKQVAIEAKIIDED